jgi:N-acetylglucosaminyl-diphospho-decaprenol L-rhamnosyltransferase
MAEVDVGVVTYNTRDLTVDALRALVSRAGDVEIRILVHDNASSDGTAAAVAAAVPEAEVEASPHNVGFGAGMNRLMERSTAPWFLALNSDAWPEPGAIRRLLDVGRSQPEVAVVAPRLERPDGTLEHSTYPFPSVRVAAITALGAYRRLWPRTSERLGLVGAWDHAAPRPVDWAVGAAWLMRRSAIDEVGGFDESFFMYAEDLEWCWRARRAGWEIWFEPGAVVVHVGNASGERAYGARRNRAHIHNAYRFYRREHGPAATAAYRAVSIAGCTRLYLVARWRGDHGARAEWASQLRAHISSVPPVDGPPPMPSV